MSIDPVLQLKDLSFGYAAGPEFIQIDSFEIAKGESLFLSGASGSGKSTLLGLIGGVLTPRKGQISLCDKPMGGLSAGARDQLRADHLGIIFQQFNLLPYLDGLQNCVLPCRFSAKRRARAVDMAGSAEEAAMALAGGLGLTQADLKRPVGALSVGQQQRVAAMRALIGAPDLIIADEPTSALDHDNRGRFIDLLNEQRQAFGSSLLFVSHDNSLAGHFDRAASLAQLNQAELNQIGAQ